MRRLAFLCALAGCGDNLPDPAEARSGSRLRVIRAVFDGGANLPDRSWFHDARRSERCTPTRWSDGFRYCTPVTTDIVFADDACSMPIGIGDAAYFARHSTINGLVARIYPPGSERLAAPHWILEAGQCSGPFAPQPGERAVELGPELTTDAFARIKTPDPIGERLALVLDTSDDGLSIRAAVHDRKLDEDCELAALSTPGYCVPQHAVAAAYFNDPECTVAVVSAPASPPRVARIDQDGCPSWHQLGHEVTGQRAYVRAGTSCVEMAPPLGERQFLLGSAIELAELDETFEPRSARIRREELDVGGTHAFADAVLDADLAADCAPVDLDGALRCLPTRTAEIHAAFGDAQCRQQLDVALISTADCEPPPDYGRDATGALHAVREPIVAMTYEISTGDRCVPYAPPSGYDAWAVDPALSADTFAAAMLVTD